MRRISYQIARAVGELVPWDSPRPVSHEHRFYNDSAKIGITQMLKQKTGGSVVSISASLAEHPIAGATASVPMMTKGGIESISKNLAMEYAKEGIRFNAVAPGEVDTPLHKDTPKGFLRTLSPMGSISDAQEIVDAVVFLAEAPHITGQVLYVDGGAHVGKW
jgi:NAD(P)-dependent dehydrogenase (short-subunit alcohol dehydrogenase family)